MISETMKYSAEVERPLVTQTVDELDLLLEKLVTEIHNPGLRRMVLNLIITKTKPVLQEAIKEEVSTYGSSPLAHLLDDGANGPHIIGKGDDYEA